MTFRNGFPGSVTIRNVKYNKSLKYFPVISSAQLSRRLDFSLGHFSTNSHSRTRRSPRRRRARVSGRCRCGRLSWWCSGWASTYQAYQADRTGCWSTLSP
uniref:(northern house mosquito) hypothetical protein n=1 Tax=Culex pipiens TaxID=7175 RepID=A0A8D8NLN2_CULPI